MAQDSKIQWTHHTFNAWSGCAKVHTGCTNCYAEALPPSMRRRATWGEVWQGGTRVVAGEDYWRQPYAWARAAAKAGKRHRVFVNSTSDVLEVLPMPPPMLGSPEDVARVVDARVTLHAARERLWGVIRETASYGWQPWLGMTPWWKSPGLDYLLLTKRPENARFVPEDVRGLVWLLASASDQKTLDTMAERLLAAEGFCVRGLSLEPLVGPVDLSAHLPSPDGFVVNGGETVHMDDGGVGLDWVIVGGESGRNARPCNVAWVRDVVRQCQESGVPVFVKQLGPMPFERVPMLGGGHAGKDLLPMMESARINPPPKGWTTVVTSKERFLQRHLKMEDKKGGDMAEWPEDLRVREFPEVPRG